MANIVYSIVGYINHLFFLREGKLYGSGFIINSVCLPHYFYNSFIIQLEYKSGLLFLSMCFPFTNG